MPATMSKKKSDPADRLKALQAALGLTDEGMAEKFGVKPRTYVSWKYRERNPSKTAAVLLAMFEKQARIS